MKEALQMYRHPRAVQLERFYKCTDIQERIDYLLQRHVNSAVREATRDLLGPLTRKGSGVTSLN